jgi:hypothetical protein
METGTGSSNSLRSTIQSKSRLPGSSLLILIDRATPGDREKALTLLNEVLESYERIKMPQHIDMTQGLLDQAQRPRDRL